MASSRCSTDKKSSFRSFWYCSAFWTTLLSSRLSRGSSAAVGLRQLLHGLVGLVAHHQRSQPELGQDRRHDRVVLAHQRRQEMVRSELRVAECLGLVDRRGEGLVRLQGPLFWIECHVSAPLVLENLSRSVSTLPRPTTGERSTWARPRGQFGAREITHRPTFDVRCRAADEQLEWCPAGHLDHAIHAQLTSRLRIADPVGAERHAELQHHHRGSFGVAVGCDRHQPVVDVDAVVTERRPTRRGRAPRRRSGRPARRCRVAAEVPVERRCSP